MSNLQRKRHTSTKSGLFLIELIVSIFFFLVAASICLQLFVKSHTVSLEAISYQQSVLWTQNLAELFLGYDGDFSFVKKTYQDLDCIDSFQNADMVLSSEQSLLLLFDEDWQNVSASDNAQYLVLAVASQDNNYHYETLYTAKCTDDLASLLTRSDYTSVLTRKPSAIYQLQVQKYIRERRS